MEDLRVPNAQPNAFAPPVLTWPMDPTTQQVLRRWLDGQTSGITGGSFATTPGGVNKDIQFNDNGVFGGDSDFQWDKTNNYLIFGSNTDIRPAAGKFLTISFQPAAATSPGGGFILTAGDGGATSGAAGDVEIYAGGTRATGATPGEIFIEGGGVVAGSSSGGDVHVQGGTGSGAAASYKHGDVYLIGQGSGSETTNPRRGRIIIHNDNQAFSYRKVNFISTTDATTTTRIVTTVPINTSVFVEAKFVANVLGGNAAAYSRKALFKRGAGAASLVGTVQDDFSQADDASWIATLQLDSNDIVVAVTGAAATDIVWQFEMSYYCTSTSVIP